MYFAGIKGRLCLAPLEYQAQQCELARSMPDPEANPAKWYSAIIN